MIPLISLIFLPLWVLFLFGIGAPICAALGLTTQDGFERALICMGVGLGTLGLVTSLIGLAGWLYPGVIWSIVVVGLLLSGWHLRPWLLCGKWRDVLSAGLSRAISRLRSLPHWQRLVLLILGLHVGLNLAVALGPPVEGDTIYTYLAVPKLFARHHGVFFAYPAPQPVSLYHALNPAPLAPLSMQMVYAVGLIAGGEAAAQLVSQLTGILLALMIFQLTRRLVGSEQGLGAGLLAAALFYMTPLANYHGHASKIDFGAALMEFSGIYAFVVWYMARDRLHRHGQQSWLWLSALFLGYAVSMRPSGLYSAVLIGTFLAILWVFRRPERANLRELLAWGTILLLVGGLWYLVTYLVMGTPVYPIHVGELPILPKGIPTGPAGMVLLFAKMSLGPLTAAGGLVESIGPLFIAAFPLIVVTVWNKRRGVYLLLGLFCVAYYVLWFQVYPITRLMMATVGVASGLAAISLTDLLGSHSWQSLKRIFVTVLLFVFSLNLGLNFIVARHFVPAALGLETRQTALAEMLSGPLTKPSWPTLQYVNSKLPSRSRILGIPWGHSYYLDQAELISARAVNLSGDASDVLRSLEESGFTHIFWNEWLLQDIQQRGDDVRPNTLDALRKSQHLELEYADEEAQQYIYRIAY